MFGFPDIFPNPLDLLTGPFHRTKSVLKSNYKVTLKLYALNRVIKEKVVDDTENLHSLEFDSEHGKLHLYGNYKIENFSLSKFLRCKEVRYDAALVPIWVRQNKVRFRMVEYKLRDAKKRKFDPIRWISRFDPFHKRMIFAAIVEEIPALFSLTRFKYEIRVDLNYFLSEVPDVAGKVSIQKVIPDKGNVYLFVNSHTILKPLMDFFGPQYLRIDPISEDSDSLLMLWNRTS